MEYFSIPFDVSLLKNHILKDPIIDWFNIKEKEDNNYKRDSDTFYKDFIIKEWKEYKSNFFNFLKNKAKLDIQEDTSIEDTKRLLEEGEPLILGAKLLYDDMIVHTDILIDVKLFSSCFPKIKNFPLHSIKNKYIIINLSFSSLNLKSDLKEFS